MRAWKYFKQEDLYYSALSGGGIYGWEGERVPDPLTGGEVPLFTSLLTGETFFLRPGGERCREMVRKPPRGEHILWPSDFVRLEKERREALFSQEGNACAERGALLFPQGAYPSVISAEKRLAQISEPSWKSPEVRHLAAEILRAVERVNAGGFLYTDIHLSRMFVTEEDKVYLDFSDWIFPLWDAGERAVKPGEYPPLEFADPAWVQGRISQVDAESQNYSLCALLFFLFLGRYAYDGRLMSGYLDDTPQRHYLKFRDYCRMPVFVFDQEDNRNRLGTFGEQQRTIRLWEALPECLRTLFTRTLRQENAERHTPAGNPSPGIWLESFRELGWLEETRTEDMGG